MPWRLLPMKDVGGCEKPRGAADQALIRGCPNGKESNSDSLSSGERNGNSLNRAGGKA